MNRLSVDVWALRLFVLERSVLYNSFVFHLLPFLFPHETSKQLLLFTE